VLNPVEEDSGSTGNPAKEEELITVRRPLV